MLLKQNPCFHLALLKHSKRYPKALELNDDDDARVCMQFVGTLLTVRDANISWVAKDLLDKRKKESKQSLGEGVRWYRLQCVNVERYTHRSMGKYVKNVC